MEQVPPSRKKHLTPSGDVVRIARVRRGWTQAELAERLGVQRPEASKVENARQISVGRMLQLDKIFGGTDWRTEAPMIVSERQAAYETKLAADRVRDEQIAELTTMVRAIKERLEEMSGRPIRAGKGKGG